MTPEKAAKGVSMFGFTDDKGEHQLINPSFVARISQAEGESYARVYLVGAQI